MSKEQIEWSCCPNGHVKLSEYVDLYVSSELSGIWTLYGVLSGGDVEPLHDWDEGTPYEEALAYVNQLRNNP